MNDDNEGKVGAIGELPRDIAPSRDLWPGIAAAIGAVPAVPRPRVWFGASPAWALAAAVACVAVGVWIGRASLTPTMATVVQDGLAQGGLAREASHAPDARFLRTREGLLREVSERLAQLSPDVRGRVEASLATVQRARADIEDALGRDPGNALLQEMLVNSYQDEMRVLTTVREIET